MAFDLATMLGGNLGTTLKDVIGAFKCDPTVKAQLQAAVEQNAELLQQKTLDLQSKLIDQNVALNATAGANIQAEEKGDFVARDARPMVIWIGLFVVVMNYVVRPWFHAGTLAPVTLPDWYWQAWTAVSMGYVVARSADKVFGGAGGAAQLPFGIKIDSKGN